MTTQQKPEALRHASYLEDFFISEVVSATRARQIATELRRLHAENERLAALVEAQQSAPSAAETGPTWEALHYAWQKIGADVAGLDWGAFTHAVHYAPQPAPSAAAVVPLDVALHAVEYLGMHNSASRETEMVQMLRKASQPAPSAQAASSAVLKAIREANMQLVRTGDDAFILVPYKVATPQADSVTAPAGGAVAAHRVMRKRLDGEWACDGRYWCDGPPSKELVESICADKDRWRVDVAYTTPPAQAADSVLEDAARLEALHAAVTAIYLDDSSDFKSALGAVVRHLDPKLAGELLAWPKRAFDISMARVDAARKQGANHD